MSRNDEIDVASQNTNSVHAESDQTRPSMDVAKAKRVAVKRGSTAVSAAKK